MTVRVVHPFRSTKPDGEDPTQVQPSYWNAGHTVEMQGSALLGRNDGEEGAVQEIQVGGGILLDSSGLRLDPAAVAKTPTRFTRAGFDVAVAEERARIANTGVGYYRDGERLDVIGEAGYRTWILATGGTNAANAAASHARTVVFSSGKGITLAADANAATTVTAVPASNVGANGDVAVDFVNGLMHSKAAGVWTNQGVGKGAAFQTVDRDGNSGLTRYLGQMATRCGVPRQSFSVGTATWLSGRSYHYTHEDIVDPVIVAPSWVVDTNNVQTSGNPNGGTAVASFEIGFGPAAKSGLSEVAPFVNGFAACRMPGKVIPKGWFAINMTIQCPGGIVISLRPRGTTVPGEGYVTGTGAVTTDYTVSGTPAGSTVSTGGFTPIMIVGYTSRPSVMFTGSSRCNGSADYVNDSTMDIGYPRIVGRDYAYLNLGIGSSRISTYNAATRTYTDQMMQGTVAGIATGKPYMSHLWGYDCINDIGGDSLSAADCLTQVRLQENIAKAAGMVYLPPTLPPYTSGAATFYTTRAGQSIMASGRIAAFNDLIRSNYTKYIDLADAVDPGRTGVWPVSRRDAADSRIPTVVDASLTNGAGGFVLTVNSVTSGPPIEVGQAVFGLAGVSGATIRAFGTGTGGVGTYILNEGPASNLPAQSVTIGGILFDGLHEGPMLYAMERDRSAAILPTLLQS